MNTSSTPERQFTDDRLAALYDVFYPPKQRADFAFYLPMIMTATSVLDIGCGTGALLRMARDAGYTGRLCGLDPAPGMLNLARQGPDIEWVLGDLSTVDWHGEFDLIVMTGHAFQELVDDDQIRAALATIRTALTADGRFAFETRNPLDRAWERWSRDYSMEITDASGAVIRSEYRVHLPVEGNIVHTTSTYTSPSRNHPEVSHGTLRFIDAETLSGFLTDAELVIEQQFGDWDRSPFTDTSREIITIARMS